jgi:hypothetical protein
MLAINDALFTRLNIMAAINAAGFCLYFLAQAYPAFQTPSDQSLLRVGFVVLTLFSI